MRKVRFDMSNVVVHEVRCYSEEYALHPHSFNFGPGGDDEFWPSAAFAGRRTCKNLKDAVSQKDLKLVLEAVGS